MGVILSQPHQREVVTCQHGFLLSSSLAHWPLQPSLRSPSHLKMTATWKERRTRREQSTMSFQQTLLNTESGTLTSSEWGNVVLTSLGLGKEVPMSSEWGREVRTSLVLEKEVHTSLGLGKEVRMSSEWENEAHTNLVLEKEVRTNLGLENAAPMSLESGNEVHMSLESGKGVHMSLASESENLMVLELESKRRK